MSDFILSKQQTMTVVEVRGTAGTLYSLDSAAELADVHPDLVLHYCRMGLLGESRANPDQEPVFDDEAIYELRRIEHYRRHHGVNLSALPLVFELLREVERLDADLRFLRNP